MRGARWHAAIQKHWTAEREMFRLRPWDPPPCLATMSDPPPAWLEGLPLALERRRQLLEMNPHHYDDIDYDRKETP